MSCPRAAGTLLLCKFCVCACKSASSREQSEQLPPLEPLVQTSRPVPHFTGNTSWPSSLSGCTAPMSLETLHAAAFKAAEIHHMLQPRPKRHISPNSQTKSCGSLAHSAAIQKRSLMSCGRTVMNNQKRPQGSTKDKPPSTGSNSIGSKFSSNAGSTMNRWMK